MTRDTPYLIVYLGTTKVDYWEIDYRKLREYLSERFSVRKAYYFMGFIPEEYYCNLYHSLLNAGFILKFKRTKLNNYGETKGFINNIKFSISDVRDKIKYRDLPQNQR